MSEVAPPLAGGRYHLRRVLGVGGMAVVYLAEDRRLDVERAVKMLRPDLDSRARERFDTEARTMAKLHHPNVVMVHDVAEEEGRAYLVMELIDGGSIADRLRVHGPLPQRMAAEVCISTLRGLQAAHDAGVIHRDIKPHNIMVAVDGTVKVTDFGIAQEANRGTTKTNTAIGTLAYMSPEQRADAKSVDGRTDVYAAGCMLYKMLTDLEPFDLYNQEFQDEIYETVPPVFHGIIQTATRYRAEDRYPSAGHMVTAIEAVMDVLPLDPVSAPPLGAPMQTEELAVPAVFLESEVSSPSLSTRPRSKPIFTWDIAVLTILAVFFLSGGAGAAFLTMMGGVVALSERSGEGATVPMAPTDVRPLAAPPPAEPPHSTELAPDAGPDPDADADADPDADPDPDPASIEPMPVVDPEVPRVAPAPAAPAPEPRPVNRTHHVKISTRPAGTVCIDGTRSCGTTPWVRELTPGTYAFDLTQADDPSRYRQVPLNVNRDRALCWDFVADSICD